MRLVPVRVPVTAAAAAAAAWTFILCWSVVVGADSTTTRSSWSHKRSFVPTPAPVTHLASDTRPTLGPDTGMNATTVADDAFTKHVESDSCISNPIVAASHAESAPQDVLETTAKSNPFAAISVLVLSHVENSSHAMVGMVPSRLGCVLAFADESIRLWHGPYQRLDTASASQLPLWQAQALLSDVLILVLHVNDTALVASQKLVPVNLQTCLVQGLEQRIAAGLSKGRLLVLGLWHSTNDSIALQSATEMLSESAQKLWRERLVLDELRCMTPDILERLDIDLILVDRARHYDASALISGTIEVMGQPNGLHSIVDSDCVVALLKQTYLCMGGHNDETIVFADLQTVDSVDLSQYIERNVDSAQDAERSMDVDSVEPSQYIKRSADSAQEAERSEDSVREAERMVLLDKSVDSAPETGDVDALHVANEFNIIEPDEQPTADGAEIAIQNNGSNISVPLESSSTLHERLRATSSLNRKVGWTTFRQRTAQRLGHIRKELRRRGTKDVPSNIAAPLPGDIGNGPQAQNTHYSLDQVTSNLPWKTSWNTFQKNIVQSWEHLRKKLARRGTKDDPSNVAAPLPDDVGEGVQAQNTLLSLGLLSDNLLNSDGLPIDFSLRLKQILNEFGWIEPGNIPVNVQDRVFDVHRQYLDQLRDHFGRMYEALLDNSDPKSWRAVRERVVSNFWQSVQTSRPFPNSALFEKSNTSCQNVLTGLESDMDSAADLRKEPYLGDDEEQNDIDNPSLAKRKRFVKWCKKMAAKGVMLGVNYLQGWLAWQAIQRAALEREREFPKFPLF
jgi:hypothetical protein